MNRKNTAKRMIFGALIAGLAVSGATFLKGQEETEIQAKSSQATSLHAMTEIAEKPSQTTDIRTASGKAHASASEMNATESETENPRHPSRIKEAVNDAKEHADSIVRKVVSVTPSDKQAGPGRVSKENRTSNQGTIARKPPRTVAMPKQDLLRNTDEESRRLNELRQWSLRMQAQQAQARARQNYYRSHQQNNYQAQRNAYEARQRMNRWGKVHSRMAARGVQW